MPEVPEAGIVDEDYAAADGRKGACAAYHHA